MFLIKLTPFKNESLSSFIHRTARENLMVHINWILEILFKNVAININDNELNWADRNVIQYLSRVFSLTEHRVEQMTYNYYIHKNLLNLNNKGKCPWFSYRDTRICPLCIKEEAYHRISWSHTYSLICLKHKCFLLDKCPSCDRKFSAETIIRGQCLCSVILSKIVTKEVCEMLLFNFQENIDNSFSNQQKLKVNNWIKNTQDFCNAINFLSTWIPQLVDTSTYQSVLGVKLSENVITRTMLKNSISMEHSLPLYIESYNILKNWPQSYHKLLEHTKNKGDNYKFQVYTDLLAKKMHDTLLKPFFTEFHNFLSLNRFAGNSKNYLSLTESKAKLSLYESSILGHDFFNPQICEMNNLEFVFLEKKEIDKWVFLYKNSLNKEELMKYWGTNVKSTYNILINKVIPLATFVKHGSTMKWYIPKESVFDINHKLSFYGNSLFDRNITFNKAVQWVGVHNAHIVLRLMISGLIPFEYRGSLGTSLLSISKLYRAIEKILLEKAKRTSFILIRDIVFLLGVKKSDVIYWTETGWLGNTKITNGSIPFNAFCIFYKKYKTSYQLSLITNINLKRIIKKHAIGKIISISGPNLSDGMRLLFTNDTLLELISK